ncbi:Selenocysteine-specific elongation factor [Candidatus Thermoflexus japonica]|uniref:Selenocysteine-specific elongation factor n=1 Tax=Candidatus Thermoflexus japonica TaxID=2035417 RepID=A0A2H5Y3I5_9CHLR|nr:Selenocysteine-specific elongation factor [Candidatus Thermoflexus japonica]
MPVIATAGHVDHGKSALVEALTGIHPDRLKEEQIREMTIDLGFAWLTLPDGETVGIVDVPGHMDFIENMLAGVGGIDAALLVIAADEGVMPQTREHFAILTLLEVCSGVVALNKIDLVDEEWRALVEEDVRALLQGTCWADAPVIPVSARTREGLGRLVEALQEILRSRPPRPDWGRARLSIDRAFTMPGFGTVVTGTLLDGCFRIGEEVEIWPSGRRARIRGLQSYRRRVEQALPGSRTAINLSGIALEDLRRGDWVTVPGVFQPAGLLDVYLIHWEGSPRPLPHFAEVKFFHGAAQILARVRLLDREVLQPGESGLAQIVLSRPTVAAPGDRFILRWPSPAMTLGGGEILDVHPERRHRRFRVEVLSTLRALYRADPSDRLRVWLESAGLLTLPEASRRLALPPGRARELMEHLTAEGAAVPLGEGLWATPNWQDRAIRQLMELVEAYHRQNPLRRGMPREEARSRLGWPSAVFEAAVQAAVKGGFLEESGPLIRRLGFQVRLNAAQQQQVEACLTRMREDPWHPPNPREIEATLGRDLFQVLLDEGRLVRLNDEVILLEETWQEAVERIRAYLQARGTISAAEARDLLGTSRKVAVAVLEKMDAMGITRRVGDVRVLAQDPGMGMET